MAPAHLQGALNTMFQLATTLEIFTANVINYGTEKLRPWGWRLSLGLAAIPSLLMTLGGLPLPETPNSLIEWGERGEGRQTSPRKDTRNRKGRFGIPEYCRCRQVRILDKASFLKYPGEEEQAAARDGYFHAHFPDP